MPKVSAQKTGLSWLLVILLSLITILLAVGLFILFRQLSNKQPVDTLLNSGSSVPLVEQASDITAVFLTNGQVYFGKFTEGERVDTLTDVYYISSAPADAKTEATDEAETPTNVSLLKLGSEVHGPTDEMKINRDQIMFTEVLRADSQVVQAIISRESGSNE